VSVSLKHRAAWELIAKGTAEWCVLAEDDAIFRENSLEELLELVTTLPPDADYVDVAGGATLRPRIGNRQVNGRFFEIDPPRDRTAAVPLSGARSAPDCSPSVCRSAFRSTRR
jgi:hypothetical protein